MDDVAECYHPTDVDRTLVFQHVPNVPDCRGQSRYDPIYERFRRMPGRVI